MEDDYTNNQKVLVRALAQFMLTQPEQMIMQAIESYTTETMDELNKLDVEEVK